MCSSLWKPAPKGTELNCPELESEPRFQWCSLWLGELPPGKPQHLSSISDLSQMWPNNFCKGYRTSFPYSIIKFHLLLSVLSPPNSTCSLLHREEAFCCSNSFLASDQLTIPAWHGFVLQPAVKASGLSTHSYMFASGVQLYSGSK